MRLAYIAVWICASRPARNNETDLYMISGSMRTPVTILCLYITGGTMHTPVL